MVGYCLSQFVVEIRFICKEYLFELPLCKVRNVSYSTYTTRRLCTQYTNYYNKTIIFSLNVRVNALRVRKRSMKIIMTMPYIGILYKDDLFFLLCKVF